MRLTPLNFLLILSLLVAEAWALHDFYRGGFEWDSIVTFLATLVAVFSAEVVTRKLGIRNPAAEHDKALLQEFSRTLPVEPTINVLKEHNFGDSYRGEYIRPLFDFASTWDNVEKEFLNKRLDKKRKNLLKAAQNLSDDFARLTVPVRPQGFHSVFPDRLRDAGPRPQHILNDATALSASAKAFVPLYEDFVRTARKALESM